MISGLDLTDEEIFCDKMDDVVTSVKRNGVAIKGEVILLLIFHHLNSIIFKICFITYSSVIFPFLFELF